jgi:hypothetical protein
VVLSIRLESSFTFPISCINPTLGLIDVGHMSIIHIKLYKDPEEIIKNIRIWKNIPLNEQVVFRTPYREMSLIIEFFVAAENISCIVHKRKGLTCVNTAILRIQNTKN